MMQKLFVGALMCGVSTFASAKVIVTVESKSVLADPTNPITTYVDVYLQVTGTGNGSVNSWQAAVDLSPSTGVSFGTPTVTTANGGVRPELFSVTSLTTPLLGGSANSATHVSANAYGSEVSLDSSNGVGLMRIPLTIAAGASGTFTLTLSNDINLGTVLAGGIDGDLVPAELQAGTLTVAIPEPASLALVIGAPMLLMRRRR